MTSIEWTHGDGYKGETWNPLRGCTKVSPGCKNCYAETFAERWRGIPGHPYEQGFDLRLVPAQLDKPLRWRKPRMVFVNSMSDLFHKDVPYEYIAAVFGVMAAANRHVFQMLTKRDPRPFFRWLIEQDRDTNGGTPGRLCCLWQALRHEAEHHPDGDCGPLHTKHCADPDGPWPLPNVWIGVSAEDQERADERIPWLLETPAAVRFVSAEPLLGPINLNVSRTPGAGPDEITDADDMLGPPLGGLGGIDWVIAGSESGPKARAAEEDWYRAIRDQCRDAGIAFFLKQFAEGGKKRSLPVLDGEQHAEFPEVRDA